MDRSELALWLRLTRTPGIGNAAARKLLASFGLPETIFQQPASALRQVVSARQAQSLLQEPDTLADEVQATWDWLQSGADPPDSARAILTLADPRYPPALLAIEDPPLLLYLHGAAQVLASGRPNAPLALDHGIAIVGSRNPTPQGAIDARQFAGTLAAHGLTIVSGLALGIDGAAHGGALDCGARVTDRPLTIAVVGTGLDRVYPRRHHDLARRIAAQGMLVSEYPIGTPPLAAHFPRRNRIIAALSHGTLVIEAALRSGSLITARLAVEQGKDVFAIPGSIHSPQSRGCHALIRQGAKLVESAQDVLEELAIDPSSPIAPDGEPSGTDHPVAPAPADDPLLQALGFDPVSLDALQARTGLETARLQAQLMALELAGQVARLPGGMFQRMAQV